LRTRKERFNPKEPSSGKKERSRASTGATRKLFDGEREEMPPKIQKKVYPPGGRGEYRMRAVEGKSRKGPTSVGEGKRGKGGENSFKGKRKASSKRGRKGRLCGKKEIRKGSSKGT